MAKKAKKETAAAGDGAADESADEVERVVPDPNKHIFIDTNDGAMALVEWPDAAGKDRRINYHGQNIEHVSNGENDVWVYRHM